MRNMIYITAMLAIVTVWGYFVNAMQNQAAANQLLITATASANEDRLVLPGRTNPIATTINAQRAYKANCSGCHAKLATFPQPMTAKVMHHMRLQTAVTTEEMRALLEYLTQ